MAHNYDEKHVGARTGSPTDYEHNYHHEEEHMSAGRYAATRIPSLKPPMAKVPNPFRLLAMLNFQQWMFFLVAFIAWTWEYVFL